MCSCVLRRDLLETTNIPIFSTLSNPLIISIIISPYSRYYRLPQRFSHLLTYLGPPSPTLSSFLHFISLIYLSCPLYYAIIPQTLLFQPSHNQAPPMDTPNSIHMYTSLFRQLQLQLRRTRQWDYPRKLTHRLVESKAGSISSSVLYPMPLSASPPQISLYPKNV